MNQTQLKYLQRIINYACIIKSSDGLSETVKHIKAAKLPVYQMMRDIACDARFYSVLQNEQFWRQYSCAAISRFIDSLTSVDWGSEKLLTGKKEDFLNEWMAKHILGIPKEQQQEIEQDSEPDPPDDEDEEFSDLPGPCRIMLDKYMHMLPLAAASGCGSGKTDETGNDGNIYDDLPDKMKNYLNDSQKGYNPGSHEEPHKADAKYINSLDPTLVELAKKIGRHGCSPDVRKGKFQTASRCDISGVTTGDNLNCLLPTELAMLASPASEKVFLHKFVQKQLQIFSSASSSQEKGKAGPIYMCIDTSSSMRGQPEETAKTLALAIAIVAQRDKRPICLINYSFNLSFFILTNLEYQKLPFLSFLSRSYGGGNDENRLFKFIFDELPDNKRFSKFAHQFNGADLLIISDFQWAPLATDVQSRIEAARSHGLKLYALSVNMMLSSAINVYVQDTMSGRDFYMNCDYKYMCDNNHCFEYKEKLLYETENET